MATARIAHEMRRLHGRSGSGRRCGHGDTGRAAVLGGAREAATPEERSLGSRRSARGIARLREADTSDTSGAHSGSARYDQRLGRFGLRDRHLDWDISARGAVVFAIREAIAALFLVPVAAIGLAVFWVPYRVTALLARRATSERDVAATAKVFVGAAVYAAWLLAIAVAAGRAFGLGAGVATAAVFPCWRWRASSRSRGRPPSPTRSGPWRSLRRARHQTRLRRGRPGPSWRRCSRRSTSG